MGTASAKIWYVDDSGGADFTKIQEAVNTANERDTIIVMDGSYDENIVINKPLTLRSENGPSNCKIIGVSRDDYCSWGWPWQEDHVVEVSADCVSIIGFTIVGTEAPNHPYQKSGGSGILLNRSANSEIKDNTLVSNMVNGVYLSHSNNNIIKNNIAKDNTHGIYLEDSDSNQILNNTVSGNELRGIYVSGKNNIIKYNYKAEGFRRSYFDFGGNIFEDNKELIDEKSMATKTPTTSQTATPTGESPEIPTGEEKGIPGFEVVFTIIGLLAVAYILGRRK